MTRPSIPTARRRSVRLLAATLAAVMALGSTTGWAQRERGDEHRGRGEGRGEWRGDGRAEGRAEGRSEAWREFRRDNGTREAPNGRVVPVVPPAGTVVRVLPPTAHAVPWAGTSYRHWNGVWYRPAPHGWAVVRPPIGVYVREIPWWATAVVIGGVSYWLINDVYYRERPDGYEVVSPPVPVAAPVEAGGLPRQFVYPRQGQSANQQASDEYECHRWAVGQSGFDPTAAATGTNVDHSRRDDYLRARGACLDGRGYTVK